jgi:hypothetical protein
MPIQHHLLRIFWVAGYVWSGVSANACCRCHICTSEVQLCTANIPRPRYGVRQRSVCPAQRPHHRLPGACLHQFSLLYMLRIQMNPQRHAIWQPVLPVAHPSRLPCNALRHRHAWSHNGGYHAPSLCANWPQATNPPDLKPYCNWPCSASCVMCHVCSLSHLLQVRGVAYGIPIGFAMGAAAGRATATAPRPVYPMNRPYYHT